MSNFRRSLRKILSWSHRWLGFVGGIFICLLAFTGGVVTFRPQIASLLSPPQTQSANCVTPDWTRAEKEIEAFGHSTINRIYAPMAPDTRYRFRMTTDTDAIYTHVIYDACAGKVIGTANLSWMDWLVDLHHNLLAGRTGRWYAGWVGVALFISGVGGILIWLISNPSLQRLFHIRSGSLMPRNLHTMFGVTAGSLLLVGSFTSLGLCFPQTMRAGIRLFMALPDEVRAPRPAKPQGEVALAGLGDIIRAAEQAIPGAQFREIRMPDGPGNVQVRMWLPSDFRSLGNNVATVDRISARVVATDLYSARPAGNRFVQAMAGLHYGEWGGLVYRSLYGIAGFASTLLFVTGILLWWLPKRRAAVRPIAISSETKVLTHAK
jgi:uncharacterized iron-regulated membrane protein